MGYLPLTAHDEMFNQKIQLDINGVDTIMGLASEIILYHWVNYYEMATSSISPTMTRLVVVIPLAGPLNSVLSLD